MKPLEYYLSLPYTFEITPCPPDEGGWFAECQLLEGCMTYADTWEELLEMIEDAKKTWFEMSIELNDPIPEPKVKATA